MGEKIPVDEDTLVELATAALHYLEDIGHDCVVPDDACAACHAHAALIDAKVQSVQVETLLREWNAPQKLPGVAGQRPGKTGTRIHHE